MAVFPVLLDACVLFPEALRDTLLRAARHRLYQLHWSQPILDETMRNLMATGRCSSSQALHLETQMKRAFPDAMIEVPDDLIQAMTNHPKDRHVLAAAVRGQAAVIVTSNLTDFPEDALEPYGIEAQHPDEFLTHLYDLSPDTMLLVIDQQVKALKNPPVTIEGRLAKLGKIAPHFVSLIEFHLGK